MDENYSDKVVITYGPSGEVVSDFECESWVTKVIDAVSVKQGSTFNISSEVAFLALRVAVRQGRLSPDRLSIMFLDTPIVLDVSGYVMMDPKYRYVSPSVYDELLMQLL